MVDSIDLDKQLIEPDGSIQYPYSERFPDHEKVKNLAITYTKGNVYSLENFDKIYNKDIFFQFIDFLKNKNIEIYFYLPPYNPYTYDILIKEKYKIIDDVEKYLIYISEKFDIQIIGSYNPHKYNFSNEDFFDGMHSLDEVYIKLFKDLF